MLYQSCPHHAAMAGPLHPCLTGLPDVDALTRARPWVGQVLAAETDFEGIGSWTLPAYSPTPGSKSCPEGR